ncbi:hypothetical protein PIB30_084284 [Stylosanthes scabra]|uniref:Uncharacterized protein n=1 Tax=Stylosanthes scabra TaxID=79078 RepID=A0ABU6TRZ5_9FABA|nr:hypothetical protein [Stylosanthes scabra]
MSLTVYEVKPAILITYSHSFIVLSLPKLVCAIITISNINPTSFNLLLLLLFAPSSITASTIITFPFSFGIASLQFFKIWMHSSSPQSCKTHCKWQKYNN